VRVLQGAFVTFEHDSNRVNIFYDPTTNLVSRVPKRG
jgi:Potato inhibitor I family